MVAVVATLHPLRRGDAIGHVTCCGQALRDALTALVAGHGLHIRQSWPVQIWTIPFDDGADFGETPRMLKCAAAAGRRPAPPHTTCSSAARAPADIERVLATVEQGFAAVAVLWPQAAAA